MRVAMRFVRNLRGVYDRQTRPRRILVGLDADEHDQPNSL